MRVATGILGLLLSLGCLFQSCTVFATSSVSQKLASVAAEHGSKLDVAATAKVESLAVGGAFGVLAALLMLVGGAFAFGLPQVATAAFALSALCAMFGVAQSEFGDLGFWGTAAVVLGLMSYAQWPSDPRFTPPQAKREPAANGLTPTTCGQCGLVNPPSATVCDCGSSLVGEQKVRGTDVRHPPVDDRLRQLRGLVDAGLINEEEFLKRKAEILAEL